MGWQKLWQDPEVVAKWQQFPPLPEVIQLADRLAAEDRRRVLDIGCGLGRHAVYLAARGFQVTATDNAPAALEACRKNLSDANLSAAVVAADMTELPFPDAHFDGLVASHVIHHCDGPTFVRTVEAITRKLAPSGYLALAVASTRHWRCGLGREIDPGTWVDEDHWEGPIPHHYCTEEEIRSLLSPCYEIESIREHGYEEREHSHWHWRLLARKRATP